MTFTNGSEFTVPVQFGIKLIFLFKLQCFSIIMTVTYEYNKYDVEDVIEDCVLDIFDSVKRRI